MENMEFGLVTEVVDGKTVRKWVPADKVPEPECHVYGDYLKVKEADIPETKEVLLCQILNTIRDIAKNDKFWIIKKTDDGQYTVGWKIDFPQMYTQEPVVAPEPVVVPVKKKNIICANCDDNRMEIIKRAKDAMISGTNIQSSPEEMAVLDDILFRAWQMGWLKEYEPDYKQRMKHEYWQLKMRYEKLHKMCTYYEAGTLDFEPTCNLELLTKQKDAMWQYLHCLEVRAQIEGIEL